MKHVLVYGMTDNPGGLETYIVGLFRRMQGKGAHLDILTDFDFVAYAEELTAGGAAIYHIPAKSRSLFKHWGRLRRILREHPEYSAVYFNILDAGAAVTMLVPFLMGRRVVAHSHNDDTEKKRLHRLCRPLLRLAARERFACSEAAARYMFGSGGGKKARIIPNMIDARAFAFDPAVRERKRTELGLGDRLTVCHVGRLAPQKNPMGLLAIFAAVHARRPDAVLLSVGDGELAAAFDKAVRERGLEGAVVRLGARNDVAELLQAADVFLFPSLYEGLGIAVLEAQAGGLACVVSDAVPAEVDATGLVTRLPLSLPPEAWAESVLAAAETPRGDAYDAMVRAGYDISCSAAHDRLLLDAF